ncbi:MAG: glycosyltransferase [Longimicrobiaceae bacterium]
MTVLHVLAPAPWGGLERVVRALAAGAARRGRETHVAALLGPDRSAEHPFVVSLRDAGVPVHAVRTGAREYLRERAWLAALCGRLGADVVHTHGYRADVIGASAARARGVPCVTTVHGFTGGGLKNRIYEGVQRIAFRGFDAVVAVSRPLSAVLAAAGVPAGRVRVIPNAWDGEPEPLEPVPARRRLGVDAGAFHVGWMGRMSREKGADVLLDAVALLADLPLVASLVGDGPERAALAARAARLGVAGRVRFHGALPAAGEVVAAFDVLALSSRTEGTPMVLFEAISASVPVVASRVGGVPDVTGEAGALLVPADDPAALAAALRRVHRSPAEAFARAEAARRRLGTRYAVDPWLDAYEALYAEVGRGARVRR